MSLNTLNSISIPCSVHVMNLFFYVDVVSFNTYPTWALFIVPGYTARQYKSPPQSPERSTRKHKNTISRMLVHSWNCIQCIDSVLLSHRRFCSLLIVTIVALNQATAHKRNVIHAKNYISKVRERERDELTII